MWVIIVAILVFICLVIASYYNNSPQTEHFAQVMGSLGPLQQQLSQCIGMCEKQNPSSRLIPHPNLLCDRYCYDKFSSIGKCKCNVNSPHSCSSTLSECKLFGECSKNPHASSCSPGANQNKQEFAQQQDYSTPQFKACNGNRQCETLTSCLQEVTDWCANMWCPSSKLPKQACIKECLGVHGTNCTSGRSWNWQVPIFPHYPKD